VLPLWINIDTYLDPLHSLVYAELSYGNPAIQLPIGHTVNKKVKVKVKVR
jgi:hypothetical protein